METPLTMGDDVQVACLPSSSLYLPADSTEEKCFTSGWGTLTQGNRISNSNVKCMSVNI